MDRQYQKNLPTNPKRRGSTPTLVQYATINAQIQRGRSGGSDATNHNTTTDEDETSDVSSGDDTDKSSFEVSKSRSQPALNILQCTSIRGKVSLLSLSSSKSPARRNSATKAPAGLKAYANNVRKMRKNEDAKNASKTTPPDILKKASSQGTIVTKNLQIPSRPTSTDRRQIRRNSWCHASGTSAVAIDNKIEQAMDLVKSHLMFAVREEVEVLKEKIAELMEKINQLELENSILRASATQETLAQLNAPPPTSSPPAGPVS